MIEHDSQKHTASLKDTVLARIDGEHIEPMPSFVHQLRNYGFWGLWILSILFGSLAVAVLIFTELNVGWEFYEATHDNSVTFFVSTLPYLWLIITLGVVVLGYFNLRNTKRGYKYPLPLIIAAGVVISTVGGVVFHSYGVGKHVEYELAGKIPLHYSVAEKRADAWLRPEKGLYAGDVKGFNEVTRILVVEGFDGGMYTFDTEFLYGPDAAFIEVGEEVSVIALPYQKGVVQVACRLMPWLQPTALTFEDVREKRAHVQERFLAYEDTRAEGYGYAPTFATAEAEMGATMVADEAPVLLSMADEAPVARFMDEPVMDGDVAYEDVTPPDMGIMTMSAPAMEPAMDTVAMKAVPMAAKHAPEINPEPLRTNPCMDLYRSLAVPVR